MTANRPQPDELLHRQTALIHSLISSGSPFDTALIQSKINQYYLTGTMQDGLLVLRRDGLVRYFVRKSLARALEECPLPIVRPMTTYRDMLTELPAELGATWLELESMPLITLERLRKVFDLDGPWPLDKPLLQLRAVKSDFEQVIVRESARQHGILLEQVVPGLLREGMSEADLLADLYAAMIRLGYHGVSRFAMYQTELVAGQLGFGTNSLYPTSFNGPGGMRGMSPAVPIIGSRERRLTRGDLVFVDVGYGVDGYHSDKTQVYLYRADPPPQVAAVHQACLTVMERLAAQLVPGAIPAEIYRSVMADLPPLLARHFMGYGDESVRFLGHGVGLQIDEAPVIAAGITTPLQENMIVALEPKCGVEGVGMVGCEETFIVKPGGAVCLTGGPRSIMREVH